jgi:ketosteroid isomerase-like protein
MGSENIEIVRRVFAAFDEGDFDEFLRLLDGEVDWRVSGYLTGDRNLRGKEEVRRWLLKVASLEAAGEDVRIRQDEFRDLDQNTVLVLGSGTITRDEGQIAEQLGWIYRVEGGKVAFMQDFLSREDALAAAAELTGSPQE